MKVKIKKLDENAKVPTKVHDKDFCYDVYATSCEEVDTGIWKYGLGLAFEIERNYYIPLLGSPFGESIENMLANKTINLSIDFRPRSSVWKTGLVLSNCEGTIDELYRGEVLAYFYEVVPGREKYKVGDRIGQIKLGFTLPIEFEVVEELTDTERGTGGFGSTGRN